MELKMIHSLSVSSTKGSPSLLVLACLLPAQDFVLADIIMRQIGTSLGGTEEIAGYAMALATSWGMSYTLLELGHVRIDILRSRADSFKRALFDVFSMIVMSGVIVTIAIKAWPVLGTLHRQWITGKHTPGNTAWSGCSCRGSQVGSGLR